MSKPDIRKLKEVLREERKKKKITLQSLSLSSFLASALCLPSFPNSAAVPRKSSSRHGCPGNRYPISSSNASLRILPRSATAQKTRASAGRAIVRLALVSTKKPKLAKEQCR
jgi:hypothetical protein